MSYKLQLNTDRYASVDLLQESFSDYIIFDDPEGYIDFGSGSSIDDFITGSAWTIEGWARFDGFGHTSGVSMFLEKGGLRFRFTRGVSEYDKRYSIIIDAEIGGGWELIGYIEPSLLPSVGEWFHYLVQVTSATAYCAIDGEWSSSYASVSLGTYVGDSSDSLYVGNSNDLDAPFSGGAGWIRISDVARRTYGVGFTPDAIDSHPSTDGDTLLLAITEGTGTTTYDLSTNSNDGTMHSAYWSSEEGYCHIEDGGLVIGTPTTDSRFTSAYGIYGQSIYGSDYKNRNIGIVFEICAPTKEKIMKLKNRIGRILNSSDVNAEAGFKYSTTLRYQIDTMDDHVYFDIIQGDLVLPDNFMSYEIQSWEKDGMLTVKGCRIDLTCRPFARGEQELLVDDQVLYCIDDVSHDNFYDFSVAKGDSLSPVRVLFDSASIVTSGSTFANPIWYAIMDYGEYNRVSLVLTSTATDTVSTTTRTLLDYWDTIFIGSSDESIRFGDIPRYFRVIATGSFEGPAVYDIATYNREISTDPERPYSGVRVESGDTVSYLDLGVVDLGASGLTYGDAFVMPGLKLYISCDDASGVGYTVDYVILMPVVQHKYRTVGGDVGVGAEEGASYAGFLDDDSIQRLSRYGVFTNDRWSYYTASYVRDVSFSGLPVYVMPNTSCRLVLTFLEHNSSTGAFTFDDGSYLHVTMWYEPRYIDIPGE